MSSELFQSVPSVPPFEHPAAAASLRLGVPINGYLVHLALKAQLGQLSADHYANVARSLTRFADAWRVVFGDGRQAMVPAERAGEQHSAIAQAVALLGAVAGAAAPHAIRNRDWPLSHASSDDLARWVLANPQWKSGHTRHNNLAALVACFSWYEEETGLRSPYRRRRMPKFDRAARREADAREYVALMKHTSSVALRRVLWCLWNVQGIRTCEMRELVWSDFRWEQSCIVLYKHKTRNTTGKPKLIGLTPRQLRFFRGLNRQAPPGTAHVFLNARGKPWTRRALALHLRRTAKRIGLDDGVEQRISAYCFRHTFATECDEAGLDRGRTALLMGHASQDMVERVYSKVTTKAEPIRKAAVEAEAARRQARRRGKPKRADQPELFD